MTPLGFVRRLVASLRWRRGLAELDEEIRFHIAMETEENLRRGMPPDQARRAAERAFGRVSATRRDVQEARGLAWLEDAARDTALALRLMRRAPLFTAAVVLLMALGIGASTSVYTVVDGVLLRALPYPQPEQIALVQRVFASAQAPTQYPVDGATVDSLRRWNDQRLTVAAVGWLRGVNVVDGERALHAQALPVSHEYLDVLGQRPARGRPFSAADERTGAAPVVLVGHDLARRLGGQVLGRRIHLGGVAHEVAGVLPPGFRPQRADLLVPLHMGAERSGTNYVVIARRRAGEAVADATLAAATAALREARILGDRDRLRWVPLHQALQEQRRDTLLLLFGAVALVLLIACANVAGLLLIKAQRRRAELALRAALGARPGRLVRQLLTEALVHGLLGGAVGVALASWALGLLLGLAPPDLAEWEIGIDGRVLAFSVLLAILTGLGCGLAPALRASRVDLRGAIAGGATGVAGTPLRSRWRLGLLAVQLALCTVLLCGAGLLVRTLVALRSVDPGFEPGSLLALTMKPDIEAGGARLHDFYRRGLARARAAPGIRRVALSSAVPGRHGQNLPVRILGTDTLTSAGWRYVTPGSFALLGVPVRGRDLSDRDTAGSQPVAVVNRAFARRYFPNRDAIGGQVQLHRFAPEAVDAPRTIVGVAGDTLDDGPRADPEPRIYIAVEQMPAPLFGLIHDTFDVCWLIDTSLAPAAAADRLAGVFASLRPGLPFSEVTPLAHVVDEHVAGERFLAWLLGTFALVALAIAAAGIYGVTAHSVSQRAREIAIRMALGATPARVLRGVVGEGLLAAALGIGIGLAAVWPLGPLLERFLFGSASLDASTIAIVCAALALVALVASALPAARAARIQPVDNLREG
jgi:predicted permease